jgi:two-component system response regulator AtoC
MQILVVDDDQALCRSLEIQLKREGHEVAVAHTLADGLCAAQQGSPDLMLVDLRLPDGSGLDLLRIQGASRPGGHVVMITGAQDMQATIEAVRLGAFDYVRKPLDIDDVLLTVEKAKQVLVRRPGKAVPLDLESPAGRREIVGADPKIIELVKQIGVLSQNRVPVLIEGKSGTGKELVARALHEAATPEEPFVAVNCSAMPAALLESELFGHEKGAFTDAHAAKPGKLELAANGTVFFDEIADMSLDFQAKLLRVLQEREFERVGGVASLQMSARVIAATNRHLEESVRKGGFREDLLFRLSVARLSVPPLCERRADIPLLVKHLLKGIKEQVHKGLRGIEEKALHRLEAYDWPGNVRELENVLTRASLLAQGSIITDEDIARTIVAPPAAEQKAGPVKTLREAEREHVLKALLSCGWNVTRTAKVLDISPTTLRKKIADYELERARPSS